MSEPSQHPSVCDATMAGLGRVGWEPAVAWAEAYARREGLEAPLAESALRHHASVLLREHPDLGEGHSVAAILLHNAVWRPRVWAIPASRRLLLLPQCLRDAQACPATKDAAGLLCARCGRCPVGSLVDLAESLGMVSLVAEGATLVRQLIATRRIGAVVGVGCLASLEKLFPEMLAFGVPGLAVPLRRSGCAETAVDADWVRHLLLEAGTAGTQDAGMVLEEVQSWFTPAALAKQWGGGPFRPVEEAALAVLSQDGKRWRPRLSVAVYRALAPQGGDAAALRCLALAVECFHKASLVHDDIEDGDLERYGKPTLHVSQGLAVALNVGDFLVGEGYRWLARAGNGCAGRTAHALFAVASEGHRTLCLGQGDELAWTARPRRLGFSETLDMMTDKTAPAFGVALRSGALLAGADDALCAALAEFSRVFGRAFQIRDDLADFRSGDDLRGWHPNLVLAALCESSDPAAVGAVDALFRDVAGGRTPDARALLGVAESCGALARVERLFAEERQRVEGLLDVLPDPGVGAWLRGVAAQALGPWKPNKGEAG